MISYFFQKYSSWIYLIILLIVLELIRRYLKRNAGRWFDLYREVCSPRETVGYPLLIVMAIWEIFHLFRATRYGSLAYLFIETAPKISFIGLFVGVGLVYFGRLGRINAKLYALIQEANLNRVWEGLCEERDTFVRANYLFRAWKLAPSEGRTISVGSDQHQTALNRLSYFNRTRRENQTETLQRIAQTIRVDFAKYLPQESLTSLDSTPKTTFTGAELMEMTINNLTSGSGAYGESRELQQVVEGTEPLVVEGTPLPFSGDAYFQATTLVQAAKQSPAVRKNSNLQQLLGIHEERIALCHDAPNNDVVDTVEKLSDRYKPSGALPRYADLLPIFLPVPFTTYENKAEFQSVGSINEELRIKENRDRVRFDRIVGKLVSELYQTTGYILANAMNASMKNEDNEVLFIGAIIPNKRTHVDELAYVLVEFNLVHGMVHSLHLYKGCFPDPETSLKKGNLRYVASKIIAGPSTGEYEIVRYTHSGEPVERPILYWVPSFAAETEAKRDNMAEEIKERCEKLFSLDYEDDAPGNYEEDYADELQD